MLMIVAGILFSKLVYMVFRKLQQHCSSLCRWFRSAFLALALPRFVSNKPLSLWDLSGEIEPDRSLPLFDHNGLNSSQIPANAPGTLTKPVPHVVQHLL
jgi:hypothetical protein